MSDPVDHEPHAHQHNPDALIEHNRVGTAEDMESTETGYEGEAPNPPLADPGPRDGTPAEDVERP